MKEIIHWSDWGQQPEIRIACTQSYERPWELRRDLPTDVHEVSHKDEPSTLYTFNTHKTTCEECKSLDSFKASHKVVTDFDRRLEESGLSETEFVEREREQLIEKLKSRA